LRSEEELTNDWITKELKNYRVLRVDGTEVNRSSSEELRTCTVETPAGLKERRCVNGIIQLD
jgi:hypothetical protein